MRKHSKFITILLSALLAVCLMQTVFVQAFATENSATPDEPTDGLYPVSMKVVKAPKTVTVHKGISNEITDEDFWKNVVLHIVYSNGEEYDVNCDGIDSEGGIVPPIAEIDGYAGRINVEGCDIWTDTVDFTVDYSYATYDWSDNSISAKFSVKQVADPHSITRLEVTKLPDKVFTKPIYTGSLDDISAEDWDKWMNSLDVNNSISNHLDGMELTFYHANGEKGSVVVNSSNLEIGNNSPLWADYVVANVDEYGNPLYFKVHDEGDYKFSISLNNESDKTVYTAKSVDNPNPSLKPVSTEDTPAKPANPAKPSGNISSATSDVATKDNAGNNNTTNGTANNGVVATGDFATPAIIATVMILAAAVMFVLKRKHTF